MQPTKTTTNTMNLNPNAKFTLACVASVDQSFGPADCIDKFVLKADGVPLFEIAFDYNIGMRETHQVSSMTCTPLSDVDPVALPRIFSGPSLMVLVHQHVIEFQGEHEFIGDAFVDSETGEPIEFEMSF